MAKRADANQPVIVRDLRKAGATVHCTHELGKGFVDLVVGFRGRNFLLEVKDPMQPPSKRRLTPAEKEWHAVWAGQKAIVETSEEALRIIGAIKQ